MRLNYPKGYNAANRLLYKYYWHAHGITRGNLELLFDLEFQEPFKRKSIDQGKLIQSYDKNKHTEFIKLGYVKKWNDSTFYSVSQKWKNLIRQFERIQMGEEVIPSGPRNPVMKAYYDHEEGRVNKKGVDYYLGRLILDYNRRLINN